MEINDIQLTNEMLEMENVSLKFLVENKIHTNNKDPLRIVASVVPTSR